MSERTEIPWCDSTVNFWSGCTKVSAGCEHCYAESLSRRFGIVKLHTEEHGEGVIGRWGPGAPRKLHDSAFKMALRLNKKPWICEECGDPWRGTYSASRDTVCDGCGTMNNFHRRRVFSLSLGDWLDPEVPAEWLARMLDTIRKCDGLDFLLCTKRPELWQKRLAASCESMCSKDNLAWNWLEGRAPRNVWVIVSVEHQGAADKRIPELLKIPAVVRGLSCEPLLWPIDLHPYLPPQLVSPSWPVDSKYPINWVIVGGESGPRARPCHIEWVRSIKDQCQAAGVPVFVKQLGRKVIWHKNPTEIIGGAHDGLIVPGYELRRLAHPKGGDPAEWPEDLRLRQFPEIRS